MCSVNVLLEPPTESAAAEERCNRKAAVSETYLHPGNIITMTASWEHCSRHAPHLQGSYMTAMSAVLAGSLLQSSPEGAVGNLQDAGRDLKAAQSLVAAKRRAFPRNAPGSHAIALQTLERLRQAPAAPESSQPQVSPAMRSHPGQD